ncbi:MAG: hypothetical protein JNJ57_02575 [Saprospiraceae bacterium]|nr:hypothetical protein [Saprospiraceae bacterium]
MLNIKNLLLLFACFYAVLYMFPQPFNEIPGFDVILAPYMSGLEALTLWFGKSILGITTLQKIEMTGSGDTTFDWVMIPVKLLLSAVLTAGAGWWLLKSEDRFGTFLFWVRTALRWYLGLYMMIYGLAKVVEGGQFASPSLYDLNQRYGDFSPMGLLWRFMGYSYPYAAFTGGAEILGGLLLMFRRTTLIGALVTTGVMVHVFMLNMCYDVPVKLFSFHLVLFGIALMAPNLTSLWQFFILQKSSAPRKEENRLTGRKMTIFRHGLRFLLLGAMAFSVVYMTMQYGRDEDKTSLRGIYTVQEFQHPKVVVPGSDSLIWNRAVIEYDRMRVQFKNERSGSFSFKPDSLLSQVTIKSYRDSTQVYTFALAQDSNLVKISGLYYGDTLRATLRRLDDSKFQLTSRGFHWINEYPFNR